MATLSLYKYFTKSQTIYEIDTKQREMIIDRLLIPISAKLVALPTKRDNESSIQIFQEKLRAWKRELKGSMAISTICPNT